MTASPPLGLLAASILSPLFGGWRPVLFLYGGISLLLATAWWVLHPADEPKNQGAHNHISLRDSLPIVLRIRTIWLVGIGKIGLWGCVMGFTGYLPLYLRGIGWDPNMADQALAAFFVVSLIRAIPIPMLSDRLGVRKPFLITAACCVGLGTMMTGFVSGGLIFIAVMLSGVMFDAFMGICITVVSEIKELGGALIGTVVGAIFFSVRFRWSDRPTVRQCPSRGFARTPFLFMGRDGYHGNYRFLPSY